MSDRDSFFAAVMCLVLFMWAMGATITAIATQGGWQSEMVKRGHAEYNQRTGAWQWKEPAPPDTVK